MRILIVDDDVMMTELLQYFLEEEGLSVSIASSSQEALQCLTKDRIDLIVSDLVMPGGGGASLLNQLEKIRPDLPVIMMSGYASGDLSYPRSLARGFWRKGEKVDQLLKMVKTFDQ